MSSGRRVSSMGAGEASALLKPEEIGGEGESNSAVSESNSSSGVDAMI